MSHASIDAKTRAERQMPEDIIRLCVGIEEYIPITLYLYHDIDISPSINDLIDDLRTALVQAGAVTVTVDGMTAGAPSTDGSILGSGVSVVSPS